MFYLYLIKIVLLIRYVIFSTGTDIFLDRISSESKDLLLSKIQLATSNLVSYVNNSQNSSSKQSIPRQSWSFQQKKIIASYFKIHIKNKQPPKRLEIEDFVKRHPDLFKGRIYTCKLNLI